MGLEHFIVRRRVVHTGGLRFVCRGPTVATVHLVLGYYGAEILAARDALDDDTDAVALIAAAIPTLAGIIDGRVARVLETCVEGNLTDAQPATLRTLAEACLSLCDLPRILAGLDVPDEPDEDATEGEDTGPSPQSIAITLIARDHGCSPLDVLDWPYEALIEVLEVREATTPPPAPDGGVDPATVPGIGVTDARRF